MNLVIDIGNTQIKYAVFEKSEIMISEVVPELEQEQLTGLLNRFPVSKGIVSTVRDLQSGITQVLQEGTQLFLNLDHRTALPFENLYETPETLGKDRLAAAAGALEIFPGRNLLVIDMGTAITIDLVNEHNQFLGGNISPGMQLRFRALHKGTGRLPLLGISTGPGLRGTPHQAEIRPGLGSSTTKAIRSGIIEGIIFELEGYIKALSQRYHNLMTILTGGDADFFVRKLKNHIFVDSNLIVKGLNRILEHNEGLR